MDEGVEVTLKQIPSAFQRLYNTITELEKAVDTNIENLSAVLRKEPTSGCKDLLKQQEQVQIASSLMDCDDRLRKVIDKLYGAQGRLEL